MSKFSIKILIARAI